MIDQVISVLEPVGRAALKFYRRVRPWVYTAPPHNHPASITYYPERNGDGDDTEPQSSVRRAA